MPLAAPKICDCGKVVPAGVRCACKVQPHKEAKARADKRRPNSNARGYNEEWRRERKAFLDLNPRCQHPDCNAYATIVDHRTPHRGDQRLFWDRGNWQGLCAHHHNSHKQRIERR